jgi:hypothetical protein
MGANHKHDATPAQGKLKAAIFIVVRPHVNSRFVDPITVMRL